MRPIREDSANDVECNAEAGRAEEYPSECDEVKGRDPRERLRAFERLPRRKRLVADQRDAMQASPYDEGPRSTVPQASEQHRHHERRHLPHPPVTIAPERNVEIFAEPRRERDVPAA